MPPSSLVVIGQADWVQELNNYEAGNLIPAGVYTLDDVKKYGQEKGVCPYFTIRRMVSELDLVSIYVMGPVG